MADQRDGGIAWTEETWNVITGCSMVSEGCANCYAMNLAGTRLKNHPSRHGLTRMTERGPVWTGELRINWEWFEQPLSWKRARMIFVGAHSDLFHDDLPTEAIAQIFGIMIAAHHLNGHIFQILTKRAKRMQELLSSQDFWDMVIDFADPEIMERVDSLDRRRDDARATCDDYGPYKPPPGLWLGVTAENQKAADERIPLLLATPAALRWVSIEPMLGPVDLETIYLRQDGQMPTPLSLVLGDYVKPLRGSFTDSPRLNWVVAGGESGKHARPSHPDWFRSMRDQCEAAGVPFLFKQWGEWCCGEELGKTTTYDAIYNYDMSRVAVQSFAMSVDGQTSHDAEKLPKPNVTTMYRVGKKAAGRLLDGVLHDAFPEIKS